MESATSTFSLVMDIIDILHNLIVGAAAIIAGLWAFRRYRKERTDEAAIDIAVDSTCASYGTDYLVFLDVILTNKGHTMPRSQK